jgi:hypothetical protein
MATKVYQGKFYGANKWLHFDGDQVTSQIELNYDQMKEVTQFTHDMASSGKVKSASGDMYYIGEYPLALLETIARKHGLPNGASILSREYADIRRKIYNDPDFVKFRVWKGQV